ncbi:MAG TPA: ATP-binding protein, partial [Caldisericia bacterium]|nr:ATP-binding protein [Caldisericia bacterium]
MSLDLEKIKNNLENFDFSELFIGQLGWSCPNSTGLKNISTNAGSFDYLQIAELSGVFVLHLPQKTDIPDPKTRQQISKKLSELYPENILIFTDSAKTQSLWLWVKTDNGKAYPREHIFIKGQPADLFLSKIASLHFDFSDFSDTGHVALSEVTKRLIDALDVERVTKRFYQDFQKMHLEFLGLIEGINDEKDRRWYASVLLNRLMFIYFLQGKLFLDNGDARYLQNKLEQSKAKGKDIFYEVFLKALFFEGFAKPEDKRSKETNDLLGKIKYLNGGLFLRHRIEIEYKDIKIPDIAFENLLKLFSSYSWNLNDTIGGKADEINPDVLGYIFEKYINQKAFGAYYTRPEITEYLCSQTIHKLVLDSINSPGHPGVFPAINFESIGELILRLDAPLCKKLIYEVLPKMRLLDPACGSGAFLVQAMKKLVDIYSVVIDRIKFLSDSNLKAWVEDIKTKHPSINYFIKKKIITDNLYGVDIMEEAVEIAKLRLFLALVSSVSSASELEPLPNIDFNILPGNSLIGLMKVDDVEFENRNKNLFRKSYQEILDEKNRQIETFRHATTYAEDLASLRDGIAVIKQNAQKTLNEILKSEFDNLGIKFEQATWDEAKNKEGKPVKRAISIADIEALHPFHWGFEFDEVINARGGFDAIITNPP